MFSSWRAKNAVEPLLSDQQDTDPIGGVDVESRTSMRANEEHHLMGPWKERSVPVWANLTSIVVGILCFCAAGVLLYFYWRPNGWRDDGLNSYLWTLPAIAVGLLGLLACAFAMWCCYCLMCQSAFSSRRKLKKHLEREMEEINRIDDAHQCARDERRAHDEAYRARARELAKV